MIRWLVLGWCLVACCSWPESSSATDSAVCIPSKAWSELVQTLHQLGKSATISSASTTQLEDDWRSCSSLLTAEQAKAQKLNHDLQQLNVKLESWQQTQQQESETAAAVEAEQEAQQPTLNGLDSSLREASDSLTASSQDSPLDWILPTVIAAAVCGLPILGAEHLPDEWRAPAVAGGCGIGVGIVLDRFLL